MFKCRNDQFFLVAEALRHTLPREKLKPRENYPCPYITTLRSKNRKVNVSCESVVVAV